MKREEFAASVATVEALEKKGQWQFIVIYLGGMLLIGLPFARIPEDVWWVHAIGIFLFFLWLIVPIPILLKKARKRANKYNLQCPHCEKQFLAPERKIVLAGGSCCYCGRPVIER